MIKCNDCGYENMDGLDNCDGCGAKLTAASSTETAGAPAVAATPSGEAPAPASADAPTGEIATPAEAAPAAPAETPAPAAAAIALVKVKLTIVRGGRQGHEFPLEAGNNTMGRWDPETGSFPEVDMEADDPEAKISRKHALIRVDGSKVTVEDIGSLNGTYVNRGQRMQPGSPVELKSGDEIIVGKTFFKVSIEPVS